MGPSLLLAGLLCVSIPVIIHLLHRQKTMPILWGAMLFLKQSMLQMKRRKQVEHWLLLLLRMAVLAFLAWLLARPLFDTAKYNPLKTNQAVDVAIVIDHSLSMGRHSGTRTLLEQAQDVIDRLTSPVNPVLKSGDTLSVVLAEHQPRKLMPRALPVPKPIPVRDDALVKDIQKQVHDLKPGLTDCTIPDAIAAAREMLSHGPNTRKIVLVVSDEQKSNWAINASRDSSAAWLRAIGDETSSSHRIEVHSYPLIPDETTANIAIGSISMKPSVAGINRDAEFTATVKNTTPNGSAFNAVKVQFSIDGKNQVAPLEIGKLAGGESATVKFFHTFKDAGSHFVKISTDVTDALAADNQSFFAVNVWQTLPVLVVSVPPIGADLKLTQISHDNLEVAMRSVKRPEDALIQPTFVTTADCGSVKLEDYYAVVLNDIPEVPSPLADRLGEYVSKGRGLWVILGSHSGNMAASLASAHQNVALFKATQTNTPHSEPGTTDENTARIEVRDPVNPTVTAFNETDHTPLNAKETKTFKWWPLSPQDSSTQVVLATSTGDPIVLERQLDAGRVVVWATSVDETWNNWPSQADYLQLVHETIYHLSDAQTRGNWENITAGQSFGWTSLTAPDDRPNLEVKVTSPDESVEMRQAHARDRRYEFTYQNAFMPGVYKISFPFKAPADGSNAKETVANGARTVKYDDADGHHELTLPEQVYYGVGINPKELDNTPLSTDDIAYLSGAKFLDPEKPRITSADLAFVITRINEGTDLWVYLAALVIISLCAETYMTFRMAGLQKNVDVPNAGLVRA